MLSGYAYSDGPETAAADTMKIMERKHRTQSSWRPTGKASDPLPNTPRTPNIYVFWKTKKQKKPPHHNKMEFQGLTCRCYQRDFYPRRAKSQWQQRTSLLWTTRFLQGDLEVPSHSFRTSLWLCAISSHYSHKVNCNLKKLESIWVL